MTRGVSWREHLAALTIYSALSLAFVDHGVSIVDNLSGQGSDPFAFVWFLAWLPFAIAHHLNPFYTHFVWCPLGVSLAWVTAVPLLAMLLLPVTVGVSPLVSYNLAILAAPVLTALSGFWLCWSLTRRFPAALVGGYLFGFSSYVMAQDTAAPNLSFAACLPLLALVVLARMRGQSTRPIAIISAVLILAAQFFLSIEVAALTIVFGGICWALAWAYRPDLRAGLNLIVVDGLITGAVLVVILSPVLVQMIEMRAMVRLPSAWHFYFTADLLNVVIPSRENLWGAIWPFALPPFNGGIQEQDAYVGLPVIVIIIAFARREPAARWLVVLVVFLLIASFGPFLWVAGWFSNLALPWLLFSFMPLLGNALPTRFALFVSLAVAVIVSRWLASGHALRYAVGSLAVLALLPALHPWEGIPQSKFFSAGEVQATLGPNPQLLILPFAINGASSYYQVASQFEFKQTGGYLGYPPAAMQAYPAVAQLFGNNVQPRFAADFAKFATATGTQFVVMTAGTKPEMAAAIETLGWPSRHVDDVTILTVPHG